MAKQMKHGLSLTGNAKFSNRPMTELMAKSSNTPIPPNDDDYKEGDSLQIDMTLLNPMSARNKNNNHYNGDDIMTQLQSLQKQMQSIMKNQNLILSDTNSKPLSI